MDGRHLDPSARKNHGLTIDIQSRHLDPLPPHADFKIIGCHGCALGVRTPHGSTPFRVRPCRGTDDGATIRTSLAQRKISPPVRKRYSSGWTGCVSTSTTYRRAREKICCRRIGGSSGASEKKKSTRRWRRAACRQLIVGKGGST